ncbi:hypothetical protein [Acinetobacter sp. c3-l95]
MIDLLKVVIVIAICKLFLIAILVIVAVVFIAKIIVGDFDAGKKDE